MLGAFRDFECALCVVHGGIKMAAFYEGHHQPRPLDHGRNRKLVEAVATGNIGVEFETLLEQRDRLSIFPERVIALPKTVEGFAKHAAVAVFASEANGGLGKFDGTTLFADQKMVIASVCGVLRTSQLVPEAGENGLKFIQRAQDPIGLTQREQGVTKLEANIHGPLEIVASLRQFLQEC